ncbi:LytR/AlgR family response regulator transcription factor [Chitinophaga rhizophila]|uniref:LytTR family DNA-binding domain-containing protein n=1 Tax=Chitinophaga rhizophila TaxID=2866212 RepID=A0ABS7GLX3_9BACT|nr:LytTR family DNA-binding domain-containing protein [Chitinophaga rhizophila]MBW8688250.1 LytTR family DNA-binding domain-containing protein [Chitinophaga rhizophila]
MKIRCVITDDEPYARKGLQGYIGQIDFLEVAGVCESAVELNAFLRKEQVDLLFLDIEMPYLSGIELLKTLTTPPKVIFTTAYEKYAMQGYELEVLDYLLKPISFERFLKAANKAYDYFTLQKQAKPRPEYFFIKVDSKLEKVVISDILFVEGMENYVTVHTRQKKLMTHLTLKMLQEHLPADQFLQPHKSYIVAIDRIDAIEGNMLILGGYQVPVSRYQKEEIMQKILQNRILKR